MKLRYTLLLLILFRTFLLPAQKDETRFIKESKDNYYSFENSGYGSGFKLPFKEITVFDKRFDTTKIGYTFQNIGNDYSRIMLKKSWSEILNSYFKKNLDSNSNQSLVIIVQTFWMQHGALAEIQRLKKVKSIYKEEPDRGGVCSVELDLFVRSDSSFQALFRLDTSFLSLDNFKNNLDIFFFMPFDSIANKLKTTSVNQAILNRRKIKLQELDSFYNDRFQIPILKLQPATGIFLNFNSFRENRPNITQFKFKKGKVTDELYAIDNGKEQLIEKYWGFYDSSGLFIKLGMNAFKAVRQQNTFELVGFQHINIARDYETGTMSRQGILEKWLADKTRKIFQVNMKTGKLN